MQGNAPEHIGSSVGRPYDVPMKLLSTCSVILIVCLAELRFAQADAIVVSKAMSASTIAEVFIEDGVIRLELEIGVQDLNAFRNLLPDELYERLGHAPQPFPERTRRFFAEDWMVRADGGEPLIGRIESTEPGRRIVRDAITGVALYYLLVRSHWRRSRLCGPYVRLLLSGR